MWRSVLVIGPLSFVDGTVTFFLQCKKRREKKKTIRDGFQEYNKVKHQDMVSLKEKEGKTNYKGSFTKRESTIKLSIVMWLA